MPQSAKHASISLMLQARSSHNMLKCKHCGSNSVVIIEKAKLTKACGMPLGTAGIIHKDILIVLLLELLNLLTSWWKKKQDAKEPYALCKACGWYEKL